MIKKIEHYSLTSKTAIYNEEAMTAIELAGFTAEKVNECVDAVNGIKQGRGYVPEEEKVIL